MTTTLYRRGSEYGDIKLIDAIMAYMPEYDLEKAKKKVMEIEKLVNKRLPGSYLWQVMTSEIIVEIDEPYELSDDEFWKIEQKAFEELV